MYNNGLHSLTIKVNYQINLTKTITMRIERRKNQNGVVYTQNNKSRDFAAGGEFRYKAKFRYIEKFPKIEKC